MNVIKWKVYLKRNTEALSDVIKLVTVEHFCIKQLGPLTDTQHRSFKF